MDNGNEKRFGVKLICVILAFSLWLYITNVENPVKTIDVKNVQVELLNKDALKQSNLAVSPNQNFTVDLKLEGAISDVYAVKSSDFVLSADLGAYALKKGENNIPIKVDNYPSGISIKNNGLLSIKVNIEERIEKEVKVFSKVKTSFSENHVQESLIVDPQTVIVSGAASAVNKVTSVSLVGEVANLDSDYSGEFQLVAVDKNNSEVNDVDISQSTGKLLINIGKQKTVPIKVNYIGSLKNGLSISSAILSNNEVAISGDKDILNSIDKIETEAVDLSQITSNKELDLKLITPEGISLLNNVQSTKLTLKIKDVATKTKTIDNIPISIKDKVNENLTYSVSPISVTVSGSEDQINKITSDNISASISVENITGAGTYEKTPIIQLVNGASGVIVSSKPEIITVTVK